MRNLWQNNGIRKKSTKRFCSTACQNEWQKTRVGRLNPKYTRVSVKCKNCGKEFDVKRYKFESRDNLYCSVECKREYYAKVITQTEEWKNDARKRTLNMLNKGVFTKINTKPQIIANKILDELNIKYENEKIVDFYSFDNYIVKGNLLIEIMGDYWHSNPMKFNKNNINKTQKNIIGKDTAKHNFIKNKYDKEILYLWENDLYENPLLCSLLIQRFINNKGKLKNYNSFNYHLTNKNKLYINRNRLLSYIENKNTY